MPGKGLRNARPPVLDAELSARTPPQSSSVALKAQLQHTHETLAELVHALTKSKRHLAAVQKKLDSLAESNLSLRHKLTDMERKAAAASHLAYHDELTGLPNRRLLLDRLNQAIAQAARLKKRVALVFFDVDGFKAINDKLGHASGDKLLQSVAQRLCTCLRAADTACRYGGDEFIVLLPEIAGELSAAVVEKKVREQIAAPYLIDGTLIAVTLSIGTAVYPVDAKNHRDLIKLADAAMYSMKTNGGVCIN